MASDLLVHDEANSPLICIACKHAINIVTADNHLRNEHKEIDPAVRRNIAIAVSKLDVCQDLKGFLQRHGNGDIEEIEGIELFKTGLKYKA